MTCYNYITWLSITQIINFKICRKIKNEIQTSECKMMKFWGLWVDFRKLHIESPLSKPNETYEEKSSLP